MVIGAGEAGKVIIKEIVDSKLLTMRVCCVVDDDVIRQDVILTECLLLETVLQF